MAQLEKISFWFQLWDLCVTINQGVSYIVNQPEDEQVWQSVQEGLEALKQNLKNENALTSEMKRSLKTLSINSPAYRLESIPAATRHLSQSVAETISQRVLECLKEIVYIERSDAEKIFRFYDNAPHNHAAIFQLLFDTCSKASLSAPLEAFEYTVKLFEEQPRLLADPSNPNSDYVYRPSKQRTFEKCPICGNKGEPYYRALSFAMNTFTYPHLPVKLWMKCEECGNLYTWKYPEELLTVESQGLLLPNPDNFLTAVEPASSGVLAIWSNILNKLSAYSDKKTLLEVGIGHGELLSVALEMGYAVDAVEIVPDTAQKVADMLNTPIWNGDFLHYEVNKTYPIIIMGDVIEHVTNPGQALYKAHQLLEDDGVLWLSTPNFESSFSKMLKFNDAMWLEPYHISYFSYRSFEQLAHKCGFAVREYNVSNRYNGSMELILTKL